ncbi:MAG: HAD-IC family P-type ATPase [Gemmatimonadaceae bacterium]
MLTSPDHPTASPSSTESLGAADRPRGAGNQREGDGWHTRHAAEVLAALGTDRECGLRTDEVERRAAQYGANRLPDPARRRPLRMFLSQFTDVVVLVLAVAAAIASAVGDPKDAMAIVAIISLNAVLGFVQEYRAERALDALRALGALTARVRRNRTDAICPVVDLVPGDIVVLEAGNIVPADLRLLETARLTLDEATLTGESEATVKQVAPIDRRDVSLGDQLNMAFRGTRVVSGRGAGVVVATGMRTELGRIASLLANEVEPATPLQRRLSRFGRAMAAAVVALCAMMFVIGLLRGEPPALMFLTALSLAVAAIPEALPAVVTVSLALGARRMSRQQALIRRLPAVEALGSVTVICPDKTGTLTENKMRVVEVYGAPDASGHAVDAELLRAMALCTDVTQRQDGSALGEPTEMALHAHVEGAGLSPHELSKRWPRVAEDSVFAGAGPDEHRAPRGRRTPIRALLQGRTGASACSRRT